MRLFSWTRRVSAITFIKYTQCLKIGKLDTLKKIFERKTIRLDERALFKMYVHALYLNMSIMYVFLSSTADNENQNGDGVGSDIVICTLVINIIMVMSVLLYICIGGTLHDKCPCKRLKEQQVRRCSTTNNDEIMIISVMESPNDQHMPI
jgi:hypothetical protein